jgi:hypothetical protein
MASYQAFLPGYLGGGFDPSKITGGTRLTIEPAVAGTMFIGIQAASAAAAGAALQAALPTANQQGLMQVSLVSNNTTV